jgi:tRNA threonylcarbamoyladenosine biosynthesis protein TsaB
VITLALDTSTRAGSVALRRDGVLIRAHVGAADVPHGGRLPADLLDLLAACDVSLPEVTLYAVAIGPGAFTGLRVGIATMQGFAFAHGRPLAGISALEACAYAVQDDAAAAGMPLVAAWADAARGEVFTALFARRPDRVLTPVDEPAVQSPQATLARWATLADADRVLRGLRRRRPASARLGEHDRRAGRGSGGPGARRTAACGAPALRPPAGCRARA